MNFRPFALIISPLVNLMEEHVRKFRTLFPFLKATHVSSLQSDDSIPDRVRRGEFDVVWMSPETILLDIWLNAFSSGDFPDRLVGVFYDEVHCVTKWGHEFRPDYLLLGVVRARLPLNVPIGGFTATLTPKARIEVVQSLGMLNHATYELSVNRPNIFLARYPYTSAEDGRFFLLQPLIKGLNKRGAGYPRTLIYCRTKELARSLAMALADAVGEHGGLVNWFHAGICDEERLRLAADFASGDSKTRVLFASIALGMGQDLADLHMIWAIDAPEDLDDWMQMLGRGGRDGKTSVAKLFFDSSNMGKVTPAMREFCTGDKCMRVLLAKHFNPTTEPQEFRNLYTEQKLDDAAIARLCCTVCATRGSTFDPVHRLYDPRDAMKYFVASMEKGNTSIN